MRKNLPVLFFTLTTCASSVCFAQTLSVSVNDVLVPIPAHKPAGYTAPYYAAGAGEQEQVAVGWAAGKDVRSERLLAAKGHFNVVEENRSIDPAQANLAARENVDIGRRSKSSRLAAHFEPNARSGEDGKMRILHVEPAAGDAAYELTELEEPLLDDADTDRAESNLFSDIVRFFSSDEKGDKDMPETAHDVTKIKPSISADRMREITEKPSPVEMPREAVIVAGVPLPPDIPSQKESSPVYQAVERAVISAPKRNVVRNSYTEKDTHAVVLAQDSSGHAVPVASRAQKKLANPVFEQGAVSPHTVQATKIRSGYHNGRVRVVIETSEPTQYKTAIDTLRNVLRVKLENARWLSSDWNGSFDDPQNLLGSYIARDQEDGSVLVEMRLRKETRILNTMLLAPNSMTEHRVVIDLSI